jgi:porphobilinogen synthase
MLKEVSKVRLRRLRTKKAIRDLVAETNLSQSSLVQPVFVVEGNGIVEEIPSIPGIKRYTVDKLSNYISLLLELGVHSILLFGIPKRKDEVGSEAYSKQGVIARSIRELRNSFPELVIAADVCLCEYTSHGHCGVIEGKRIVNDRTVEFLSRASVVYAEAGADIVAPSAMMDHQVSAIRMSLDKSGYEDTLIMSYSAKFASSFYTPFRDAAGSSPLFGDRKSYQLDLRNQREAIREIRLDILEGADIVMVKPALTCLDIIATARKLFDVPIAAYSVSGEYCMIKAAAKDGFIDERNAVLEFATSVRRAGASILITYYAEQLARWIGEIE